MRKAGVFLIFLLSSFFNLQGQVRLPQLISDGMVLQRDAKVNIWGWASPGEKVNVKFMGKNYNAVTGKDGKWKIVLSPMKPGGPYTMDIKASNHIVLNNILIGDVWFCSGQSNMVLPMERVKEKYPDDIANAHYPQIRNFFIPTVSSVAKEAEDLPASKWVEANPTSVLSFGAASYFFARQIYQKYRIPIGIINSSVGGTPIQAWISEDGLKEIPSYMNRITQLKDSTYVNGLVRQNRMEQRKTTSHLNSIIDEGLSGPMPWYAVPYIPEGWKPYWLPGYWEDQGIRNLNGIVWFRKEFDVPSSMAGKPAKLFLGRMVDADKTYVNGVQVGEVTYQYPPRRYTIPEGILKQGKNVIVVRVTNTADKGGFVPDKPYYLTSEGQDIDLRGDWTYKVGAVYPLVRDAWMNTGFAIQDEPTGLYNTMVAPVTNYTVKGILWYQGESDTMHPDVYEQLLPALITDWRKQWKNDKLPFVYAQLHNFLEVEYSPPMRSGWAGLREVQRKALAIPYTGMAVIIDAGEWNDPHPLNKKVVGERLALAADNLAYGDKTVVPTGPLYQSAKLEGNHIIISFTNTGSGLMAKSGDLDQFAIAGADKKYVWAKAVITGNQVSVSSDQIVHPMYVRYAWADNPDGANLYNKEGLPASPFDISLYDNMPQTAWENRQCAVVLTYDDALDQHLDLVIPSLDSLRLKGTFYVIGSSPVVANRMEEWKQAANRGHELGNHTMFHPCDGSQPGRGFVTGDNDLSKYTLVRAINEIKATNTLLEAIDGKKKRTFAYPCGDLEVGGVNYYDKVKANFAGARGGIPRLQTADQVNLEMIDSYMIQDQSAEYMIALVKKAQETRSLLVFMFHGVGGGHNIDVGFSEHRKLIQYLKEHETQIWTTTMVEAAEKIRQVQSK